MSPEWIEIQYCLGLEIKIIWKRKHILKIYEKKVTDNVQLDLLHNGEPTLFATDWFLQGAFHCYVKFTCS